MRSRNPEKSPRKIVRTSVRIVGSRCGIVGGCGLARGMTTSTLEHRATGLLPAIAAALGCGGEHTAEPLSGLSDDQLAQATAGLARLEAQVSARRLAFLAEADRRRVADRTADTGTDAWAAKLTGDTREVMRGGLLIAQELDEKYHYTRDAFAAGRLNLAQVRVIVRAARQAPPEATTSQLAQAEQWLVDQATGAGTRSGRGIDAKRLRQTARRMFSRIDLELALRHEAILLGRESRHAEADDVPPDRATTATAGTRAGSRSPSSTGTCSSSDFERLHRTSPPEPRHRRRTARRRPDGGEPQRRRAPRSGVLRAPRAPADRRARRGQRGHHADHHGARSAPRRPRVCPSRHRRRTSAPATRDAWPATPASSRSSSTAPPDAARSRPDQAPGHRRAAQGPRQPSTTPAGSTAASGRSPGARSTTSSRGSSAGAPTSTNSLPLCGHHHRRAHDDRFDLRRHADGGWRFHRRR